MGSLAGGFVVPDLYHSQIIKPIRIISVGCGISGLCLAYKAMKGLESFELTIYEKNSDIGGTWLENRYPGCACDIPAHIYTFTFDPKSDWSEYYAGSKEIHGYCKDFYEKHQISQFTKLSHVVTEAVWDSTDAMWKVQVEDRSVTPPRTFRDECHVLINTSGFLNKWTWPRIKGIETFKMPKIHSAQWDPTIDLRGKIVGLIGNGSSAIQIVPKIAQEATALKVFMRSPTWISPAIGGATSWQFQNKHGPASNGQAGGKKADGKHGQFTFSEEEKQKFREDPAYHLAFRRAIEAEVNFLTDMFLINTPMQKEVQQSMIQQMENRIGPGHEELKAKLIPSWAPGCRRITPGDGYLEALVSENVEPVFGEIARLTENAIELMDGSQFKVDVLVCATGFDTSFIPPFSLVGRDGLTMETAWKDYPDAYLALAAPGFPNYFVATGPGGPLGNGTILPAIETACEYFVDVMRKMQEEKIKSIEPKRKATSQLQSYMRKFHDNTVWSLPCRSWYKNGTVDGVPQLWTGSALTFVKTIKRPRYEDYEIEYESDNQWAYLGNGKTRAFYEKGPDGKVDIDSFAPYIRNDDSLWTI